MVTPINFQTIHKFNDQTMDSKIDISGIDKIELLRALWTRQIVAAFFRFSEIPPPDFDESIAEKTIHDGYIDYFCGRAIKADLSGDILDPRGYDRNAGAGRARESVASLRKN